MTAKEKKILETKVYSISQKYNTPLLLAKDNYIKDNSNENRNWYLYLLKETEVSIDLGLGAVPKYNGAKIYELKCKLSKDVLETIFATNEGKEYQKAYDTFQENYNSGFFIYTRLMNRTSEKIAKYFRQLSELVKHTQIIGNMLQVEIDKKVK